MSSRRRFLGSIGSVAAGLTIAGCTGAPSSDGGGSGGGSSGDGSSGDGSSGGGSTPTTAEPQTVEVAVGPEKRLRYDPEEVTISVGDTVRWTAKSAGHNVTSKPGASEKCKNPEGAEPFASYEGSNHFAIMEVGATYEHTFEVPGEYVYVCAPHAGQGMVATVIVEE